MRFLTFRDFFDSRVATIISFPLPFFQDDWTPLHHACQKGHPEVLKILLEHGTNIEAKNRVFGFEFWILSKKMTNLHSPLISLLSSVLLDSSSFCLLERSSRSCEDIIGISRRY